MTAYRSIRRIASPAPANEEGTQGRLCPVVAITQLRNAAYRLCIAWNPGPHAQHEPALHQVVDHRDLCSGHRWVVAWQAEHAGAEGDRRAGIGSSSR